MTRALMIHLPVIDPAKALAQAKRVSRAPDPAAPPPVSIATRRDLFGTFGAMMLLTAAEAGATKAAELDGDLLDLCAEYIEWTRAERAAWDAMTEGERQADTCARPRPWSDEANKTPDKLILSQIARLPARTPEGVRAKADVLVWVYGGDAVSLPREFSGEAPLFSLLRDLTGRTGV